MKLSMKDGSDKNKKKGDLHFCKSPLIYLSVKTALRSNYRTLIQILPLTGAFPSPHTS
jgi:hypothetical protein